MGKLMKKYIEWSKYKPPGSAPGMMVWKMKLWGRDVGWVNRIRQGNGYKYIVTFTDWISTDVLSTKSFNSLENAKKYMEHFVGAR